MDLLPLGDSALLVRFGESVSDAAHHRVRAAVEALEHAVVPGMVEVVPAFASLAVHYDPVAAASGGAAPFERVRDAVARVVERAEPRSAPQGRVVEIPVCYGGRFGPDLEAVARHAGLDPGTVVELHAGAEYTVHMIGFAPGFPYLGGLPDRLATPRRAEPRIAVPAGSVGIAGAQTGIYPVETPGGWQLVGRTPRRLFRPDADPPTLLRLGDRVRFRPVPPAAFDAWEEPAWR